MRDSAGALSSLWMEVTPSHVVMTHGQALHTAQTLSCFWYLWYLAVPTNSPFSVVCTECNGHEKLPPFEPIFVIPVGGMGWFTSFLIQPGRRTVPSSGEILCRFEETPESLGDPFPPRLPTKGLSRRKAVLRTELMLLALFPQVVSGFQVW